MPPLQTNTDCSKARTHSFASGGNTDVLHPRDQVLLSLHAYMPGPGTEGRCAVNISARSTKNLQHREAVSVRVVFKPFDDPCTAPHLENMVNVVYKPSGLLGVIQGRCKSTSDRLLRTEMKRSSGCIRSGCVYSLPVCFCTLKNTFITKLLVVQNPQAPTTT